MKIPTKIRYGLRAMIELALNYGEGPLLAQAISERQDISKKYLESLLASLKSAGLITSVRGSKGGYELSRSPKEINPKEIFEALDGPLAITECSGDHDRCDRSGECVALELWDEITRQMHHVLVSIDLETLARRHKEKHERNSLMYYI